MIVIVLITSTIGCKENEVKKEALIHEAIKETRVNVVPRELDTYFTKALTSLKEEDRQVASKEILQGVDALLKEGKDVLRLV